MRGLFPACATALEVDGRLYILCGLFPDETHHHIVKRQVSDPRRAAHDWDNRLPKRATVSAVPTVCLGTQAAYGQCGGIGFTGDTCCISGFSCVVSDAYCKCRALYEIREQY